MPRRIQFAEQRIIILKLILEIFRTYCGAYFGDGRFGPHAMDLLLLSSIAIGQAEGRPMNVSKLAAFAGIPRGTAIRKLKAFREAGLLEVFEESYNLRPGAINSDAPIAAVRTIKKLIVDAAAQLSKLDT